MMKYQAVFGNHYFNFNDFSARICECSKIARWSVMLKLNNFATVAVHQILFGTQTSIQALNKGVIFHVKIQSKSGFF